MKLTAILAAAALAIAVPVQAQEPCIDIEFSGSRRSSTGTYLTVTATVSNNCSGTIQYLSYDGYLEDEQGQVLDSAIANATYLAPGSTKRIEFLFRSHPNATSYSVEPSSVMFE